MASPVGVRRPIANYEKEGVSPATAQTQSPTVRQACLSIEDAWKICGSLYCEALEDSGPVASGDIDQEILFCLLGGFAVTYELCRSATEVVASLRPFSSPWDDDDLFEALASTLAEARFEPRRSDGSLRRYRFPLRKASLVVEARHWLEMNSPLTDELESLTTAKARRRLLCSCPGFGMKTASWLLRNMGWGGDLAILDVHLVRALSEAGKIGDVHMPRDYESVERAFLKWCRELRAPPAAFDLFVWEWQRGNFLQK